MSNEFMKCPAALVTICLCVISNRIRYSGACIKGNRMNSLTRFANAESMREAGGHRWRVMRRGGEKRKESGNKCAVTVSECFRLPNHHYLL